MLGLAAILLDIDKAIRIIRNTEKEEDVVPNLASGFNLNTRQAEYIAEIKLRNLNRQYIINRVQEIESLRAEIDELKETIKGGDVEAIKADTEALQKAFYPIAEKIYKEQAAANGAQGGATADGDGNVYGADFEDKTN